MNLEENQFFFLVFFQVFWACWPLNFLKTDSWAARGVLKEALWPPEDNKKRIRPKKSMGWVLGAKLGQWGGKYYDITWHPQPNPLIFSVQFFFQVIEEVKTNLLRPPRSLSDKYFRSWWSRADKIFCSTTNSGPTWWLLRGKERYLRLQVDIFREIDQYSL